MPRFVPIRTSLSDDNENYTQIRIVVKWKARYSVTMLAGDDSTFCLATPGVIASRIRPARLCVLSFLQRRPVKGDPQR